MYKSTRPCPFQQTMLDLTHITKITKTYKGSALLVTTKQARLAGIERQIQRLRRRINLLEQRSQRYSWIRVIIFFGGLLLSASAFLIAWWAALIVLLITVVVFSILVYLHGRIDRSLNRHM